jgi:AcrR family transcriptional regulator
MPKIIKDAKETIVREARALLSESNAAKLNMRTLAESAGIAAGTLYNYFPSKEDLIVAVIKEDWEKMLSAAEKRLSSASSAIKGLEIIFDAISQYTAERATLWSTIRASKKFQEKHLEYHKEMIDRISDCVRVLGMRFGFLSDKTVAPFISEVLMTGGVHPDGKFCYLAPCLKIIVGEKDESPRGRTNLEQKFSVDN